MISQNNAKLIHCCDWTMEVAIDVIAVAKIVILLLDKRID
jgi:hypothetical protein